MVIRPLDDRTYRVRSAFTIHSFGSIGESCIIVHSIISEPENVLSNVFYLDFRRSRTVWLQFEKDTFRRPLCGAGRGLQVDYGPIR